MTADLNTVDWTLIQSFCAVAEEGSLSAAARRLGQSQPTTGRHVQALEQALGLELFRRVPRGLRLTRAGQDIYTHAAQMKQAAARLRLVAEGRADDLAGSVRITASVIMAHFTLPPILADIRIRHPEISIELVPSDTTENLLFREADIAVRMYRPTQPDVIARHVADRHLFLCPPPPPLPPRGRLQAPTDIMNHDFVGYDRNDIIIRFMREGGLEVDREFFPLRCDDQAAYWHLVRAGGGIGGMQTTIGDADPLVERVLPDMVLPPLPVWLAAPDALRSNARVRRVWDLLAHALAQPPA